MPLVLIIDDSSYMRGVIMKILKPDGYEMIEAEDGLKGLQLVAQEKPDCIVMDLIMPGIDGLKTLNLLREQGARIPVVVVTADIQETVRKQCFEQGAAAFINKPPGESELRNAVRKALDLHKESGR